MLLTQRINFKIFLISLAVISLLTGFSFTMAFRRVDFQLFEILRFPTHTLFWDFFGSSSFLFRTGIFINVAFYSLVFERLITFLKAKKSITLTPASN